VIRTRREAQEVVVEIEDNGPGIAAEHLPKLFDPFFTTRPPGAGAGLGLNICYSIVTNHQGQIKVTSEKGQTVFQVRLPVDHVSF
jgi:signal transduction histidine kinase